MWDSHVVFPLQRDRSLLWILCSSYAMCIFFVAFVGHVCWCGGGRIHPSVSQWDKLLERRKSSVEDEEDRRRREGQRREELWMRCPIRTAARRRGRRRVHKAHYIQLRCWGREGERDTISDSRTIFASKKKTAHQQKQNNRLKLGQLAVSFEKPCYLPLFSLAPPPPPAGDLVLLLIILFRRARSLITRLSKLYI